MPITGFKSGYWHILCLKCANNWFLSVFRSAGAERGAVGRFVWV